MACSAGCLSWLPSHPWTAAVSDGDEETMRRLLAQDIGLAKRSVGKGLTAWHFAAARGNVSILKLLVDTVRSATPDSLDILTGSLRRYVSALAPADPEEVLLKFLMLAATGGMSPLMVAAQEGQQTVVAFLLGMGADPWQHDRYGLTALHHAARKGHVAVIQELLLNPTPPSARACHNVPPASKYVDCMDAAGWAPLHYATYRQHLEAVSCLLSNDGNLTARSLVYHDVITNLPPGCSALHIAASQGNLQMIQLILRAYYESSADLLPNQLATIERRRRQRSQPDPRLILSRTGRLAFHIALRFGQHDVLEWLDPSIPLMFLLSGSDDAAGAGAEQQGGSVGGMLSLANVPRLTVLAANALHALLIASLERVEQEMQEKEKQREQQKLAKLARMAEKQKANLAKQAHRFRAMLSRVTGRASRDGRADGQEASMSTSSSRTPSRPSKPKPKARPIVQTPGRYRGAANSRIMQILASNTNMFERRSDYNEQNMRMGIAIPHNPGDDPVAVLTRANTLQGPAASVHQGAQQHAAAAALEGGEGGQEPRPSAGESVQDGGGGVTASSRGSAAHSDRGAGTPRSRHSDPGDVQHILTAMAADEVAATEHGLSAGEFRRLSTTLSMSAAPTAHAHAEGGTSSLDLEPRGFNQISIIGGTVPWAANGAMGGSGRQRAATQSEPGKLSFAFAPIPQSFDDGRGLSPFAEGSGGGGGDAARASPGAHEHPSDPPCSSSPTALQQPQGGESVANQEAESKGAEPPAAVEAAADEVPSGDAPGPTAAPDEPLLAHLPGSVDAGAVDSQRSVSGQGESQAAGRGLERLGSGQRESQAAGRGLERSGSGRGESPAEGRGLEGVFADATVASSARRGLRAGGSRRSHEAAGGRDEVLESISEHPAGGSRDVSGTVGEVAGEAAGGLGVGIRTSGRTRSAPLPADVVAAAAPLPPQQQEAAGAGAGAEAEGLGGLLNTITKHLKKTLMSAQVAPLRQSTVKVRHAPGPSNLSRRSKSFSPGPPPLSAEDSSIAGSDSSFTDQMVIGAQGASAADEDEDVCPVCLDESPNVQLEKCKHKLCLGCARDLCNRYRLTPALCPCCRSIISGFRLD